VAVLELVYVSRLPSPELLEAAPGTGWGAPERAALMEGFDAAFLFATAFAAVAFAAAFLTRSSAGEGGGTKGA
jgi:hypothetical protein